MKLEILNEKEYDKFVFQPLFEASAHQLLLAGKEASGVTINVLVKWTVDGVNKEQIFDMVIDFAIDEAIDAANVQFSEFHAKNDCYFNVRSSHSVYSVLGSPTVPNKS